jgi:hypothetical protein
LHPPQRTSTGRGAFQAIALPPKEAPQRPQNFVPAGWSIPQRVQRILDPPMLGWFRLGELAGPEGIGLAETAALSEVTA